MARKTILIVEDEPDIREILEFNLRRAGFEVRLAVDGFQALEGIRQESPDLVVLDLMLPGVNGLEVCRSLKLDPRTRRIPLVMVTARGEESDVVLGLGLGADDYVTKPFKPRELVARIEAVLRRSKSPSAEREAGEVTVGDLVIDPRRHRVSLAGESIDLTATEFRLLHLLAARSGRVFTREQLLTRVIGGGTTVTDRNIDVHIRALRRKLGARSELIETVRGVGYTLRSS